MHKIYIISFFILLTTLSYSQPWLKNLPQNKTSGDLTFFDYQNAFYSYWAPFNIEKGYYFENGIKKKAAGWKQFKRWEYEMESKINPRTGEFPDKTAMDVYKEFIKNNPPVRTSYSGNWSPLGPDYSYSGYSGIGRINCVAFHPTDHNTYWVGAAAGGLWMTTDNGTTWNCLTNEEGVLAVSDIVIPPDFGVSNTIYIGTGDRDAWDNRSIGVLKSTDGGASWNETGITFSIYNGSMVNRLLIDPFNNEILIVATTNGVYKTFNGGETWDVQLSPIEFIDMEYKPGDSMIIYGSTKSGQIYRSLDGGSIWEPIYEDPNARRIELAVSPNQPSVLYAVAVADGSGLYGIYKSVDNGLNLELVFDGAEKNLLSWSSMGDGDNGQGWYDLCLAASPVNADVVLVGGINTWRSTDGGSTWTIVNHWYGDLAQEVHADKHNLRFRDNGDLFECNDGGIYMSSDNGTSWLDKTNGIQISQMYRLGVSQTERNEIITGLQDNGTKLLSGHDWSDHIGGDGMECLIDYTDVNVQYGTLYNGILIKTTDHWENTTDITPPDDGAWVTPFVVDPVNPQILYAGYTEVWQSVDRGDIWYPVSFLEVGNKIRSMAISASDPLVLYVASNSRIWKTMDAGGDWINVTNNLSVSDANIEYITIKHDDPNTVWVTLGGYTNPGVYESTDGGMTWTNISEGLPPIPVYTIVQNKLFTTQVQLYAGTEIGIYFKRGDQDWHYFNSGLPNVEIGELEFYYAPDPKETMLRAATFGRGLWETPVIYSEIPVSYSTSDSLICHGQTATLNLSSYSGDIQWQESPDGVNNWNNVSGGVGGNTDMYVTEEIDSTTSYRAEVIEPGIDTLYSNVTTIAIVANPDTIGVITGDTKVCQGDQLIEYSIEPVANADSYVWTLPQGYTGASTSENIIINFESFANPGFITVAGRNAVCDGETAQIAIDVNVEPGIPQIGSLTQPSCTVSTGEVIFTDLPSDGVWSLLDLIHGDVIINSVTSFAIADLEPGTYEYNVTSQFGCTSPSTISFIINDQPSTPPTPLITSAGHLLISNSPVGNQWYYESGIIAGATQQEYLATQSGNYYVIVTLECSSLPSSAINLTVSGTELDSIFDQGIYRTFIVHLPAGYNEKNDYPIVFNLHGYNSNASQQQAYSQFDAVADAEEFIVVYPNAVNNSWDLAGSSDVDFISHLVDTIRLRYSTNNCLFFTGMSQGGFMSYNLACELTRPMTAIAVVTGNMTIPMQSACNSPDAFPVMHFHGTEDAFVNYNGEFGIPPVEETIQWWADANHCDAAPGITSLADTNPDDGSTVEKYEYNNCDGDSEVIFYKITGGGHTWPGASPVPPLGNTNQDIDASVIIGDFFSSHCNTTTALKIPDQIFPFNLYPNPASESFTIEYAENLFSIAIFDITGKKILELRGCMDATTFNCSALQEGVYVIRVMTETKDFYSRLIIVH